MDHTRNKICIYIKIKFFEGRRKTPVRFSGGRYRPHFVIKNDSEYLGVQFIDGEEFIFEKEILGIVQPIYRDTIDYSKLVPGTEFFILEGATLVGEGVVIDKFKTELC
ncbi:hypothetical protein LIY46_01340 [Fusobacterium varium]|jgi:hypothetical protein|uniref:hypothetical protein n=1 Tax=Fusobacterium TaxID=848 RepID=UPI0015A05676